MPQPPRDAVLNAAKQIAVWNDWHDDNFRERAAMAIADAREAFRTSPGAPVPGPGEDPLFDKLDLIGSQMDASPDAIGRACREVIRSLEGAAA